MLNGIPGGHTLDVIPEGDFSDRTVHVGTLAVRLLDGHSLIDEHELDITQHLIGSDCRSVKEMSH